METIEKAKIKHFGDSYGEWNSSQVIYDIYGAIFKTKVLSLLTETESCESGRSLKTLVMGLRVKLLV